ncbi:hypothetical protein [Alloactinosynnema sp. L-07]|nr:hypothetical protein [Alloactinosynnema sp. L-07]
MKIDTNDVISVTEANTQGISKLIKEVGGALQPGRHRRGIRRGP